MFEDREKTHISELGEFGLIDHLTKKFESTKPETILGIGDDAAMTASDYRHQVISTDMFL